MHAHKIFSILLLNTFSPVGSQFEKITVYGSNATYMCHECVYSLFSFLTQHWICLDAPKRLADPDIFSSTREVPSHSSYTSQRQLVLSNITSFWIECSVHSNKLPSREPSLFTCLCLHLHLYVAISSCCHCCTFLSHSPFSDLPTFPFHVSVDIVRPDIRWKEMLLQGPAVKRLIKGEYNLRSHIVPKARHRLRGCVNLISVNQVKRCAPHFDITNQSSLPVINTMKVP